MPFPLHALDYGSLRRLRQLATPGEAHDLQIAAPHFGGFNPIQKVFGLVQDVKIGIINNECCAEEVDLLDPTLGGPLDFTHDELYMVNRHSDISNITSNHIAQTIFDRFIFDTPVIHFNDCTITPQFLRDFAAKTKRRVLDIVFADCIFYDGVTIELLYHLFYNLTYLTLDNVQLLDGSWFDTNNVVSSAKPNGVTFFNASTDILNVDETTLIKFMKKQREGFHLFIDLKYPYIDREVRQMINRLFNKRFWSSKPKQFLGKLVHISSPFKKKAKCYELRNEEQNNNCTLI